MPMAAMLGPCPVSLSDSGPVTPGPVPGQPGDGIEPKVLRKMWKSKDAGGGVIQFYKSRCPWGVFSNFFKLDKPYTFVVPAELCAIELTEDEREVECEFAEKAIMLVKAASCGDHPSYQKIAEATEPKTCKSLGRNVQQFQQGVWDRMVCSVAYQAVCQKFRSDPKLRAILNSSGDAILAEATEDDVIWGIGINVGGPGADVALAMEG